jgi:hypothetical protein
MVLQNGYALPENILYCCMPLLGVILTNIFVLLVERVEDSLEVGESVH